MAFGRDVLENNDDVLDMIGVICQEESIEKIVLGLPISEDADDVLVDQVRAFGQRLEAQLGLPVAYEDERLSSVGAEAVLREQGYDADEMRGKVDVLAAQRVLQQWMKREGS